MKTKKFNKIISRLMLIVLSLVLAFSLFACDGGTLPAPVVKKVTLNVEAGYLVGEIGVKHTLSYEATDGSEVEVTLKKGTEAAASTDATYVASTKTIEFAKTGEYTVTVKATMNGVSDEESVKVTAIAPAPVLSNVTIDANAGQKQGKVGQEHLVNYTVSKGSVVNVAVMKNGVEAQSTDYEYVSATKVIKFNTEGDYEVVVTATKNSQTAEKIAPISIYSAESPTFTEAANIKAKAGETAGMVDAVHVLSYDVQDAASVEVSAKKDGGDAVVDTDYTYDETEREIVFLMEGDYEVIVTAYSADGQISKSIATIQIKALAEPVVSNLLLIPSEYGYIRGQDIGVSYEVQVPGNAYPASDCEVEVTVQRGTPDGDGYAYVTMTEGNGYTYDPATNKLSFVAAGHYRVTVTATAHGAEGVASVTVDVRDFAKPEFEFAFDKTEAEEETPVALTIGEISYDIGDGPNPSGETVQFSVRYKLRADSEWEESIDDGKWMLEGDADTGYEFTANKAGYYELTAFVVSAQGTIGRQVAILHATPKPLVLTPSANYTDEWMRIAKNQSIQLDYTVSDTTLAEESYDITVVADDGFTINGTSVTAQFSEANTYVATITYTHKSDSTNKKVIEYKLSVVDDVENAPKFVGDPFGDMFDTLVPNVGLMLYSSATDKDGGAVTVTYALVDSPNGVSVKHIANNNSFPSYLLATNANTKTFKVKMTVSDGTYEAVSTKTFSVKEVGNNKDFANMVAYGENFDLGDMDLANLSSDMQSKLCMTKTGVIDNRDNANFGKPNGDTARVMTQGLDNFQIDFKMTFYGRNSITGVNDKQNAFSLSLGFRTVNHDGWGGNIAIKNTSETQFDAYDWLNNMNQHNYKTAVNYTFGDTFYFRLTHVLNGSTVTYSISYSTTGAEGSYTEMHNAVGSSSNSAGNGGAPVYMMQFGYEAGCFSIENVTLTNLG